MASDLKELTTHLAGQRRIITDRGDSNTKTG